VLVQPAFFAFWLLGVADRAAESDGPMMEVDPHFLWELLF
jgi:hypothetical protein